MAKPKKSEAVKESEEKPVLATQAPELDQTPAAPEGQAVHPKFHKFSKGKH